jgi:hypothetical protein
VLCWCNILFSSNYPFRTFFILVTSKCSCQTKVLYFGIHFII